MYSHLLLLSNDQKHCKSYIPAWSVPKLDQQLEKSKELNHLAAILHGYAGGLIFMK